MKKNPRKKRLNQGAPSGFLISLIFHAVAFFIAGLFVVFTVLPKEKPKFEQPPPVARPKMNLKKPKVKIMKSAQPKPSSRIVAKVKTAKLPEIQIPDLIGSGEGLLSGLGMGGDFMDIPDMPLSLFGRENSIGNDFEGHLYQLSHNRSGGAASMDENEFRDLLREYVTKGWDDSIFEKYYRFPKKLYATHFIIPPIPSPMAPYAFGAPDMECYYMFAVYKGKLVFHKDIKFRFWGMGDAYLFVNVDGKEVLVNGWRNHVRDYFNWWKSHGTEDMNYMWCNLLMSVGDWIELKAGEPVDMKVLFGEWKGDVMGVGLMVEVEGEDYPPSSWNGPLLPVFKTEELSWDAVTEICKHLPEGECSLTNGPVFSDFEWISKGFSDDYGRRNGAHTDADSSSVESPVRTWTLKNGSVVEGEYKKTLFDKIVLESGGQEISILPDQLSAEDQSYVRLLNPPELKIEFSRSSKQMSFPPELFAQNLPPAGTTYQFTAEIKQSSSTSVPYGFPLTVEFFAVGEQIMADKRVLLDHQVETFTLSEENNFSFVCTGKKVDLYDYNLNRLRRGTRYGGYLVVVRDQRGVVVAHKETSKSFYRNLDDLSRLKVGWFFDDDCKRCLPRRPPPWNLRMHN